MSECETPHMEENQLAVKEDTLFYQADIGGNSYV
jgi:hypothetical protein